MAKKILSEAQVRRFAKLANLSPINEMSTMYQEDEIYEEESPMEDVAADAEMEADTEMDAEMDAEMDEGDLEERKDLVSKVVQAVADALDVEIEVEDEPGGEEEVEAEVEAELDAPEADAEMGEEDVLAEALSGINYVPDRKEIVNEVAKRVALRLLKAKKANVQLQEALGNKSRPRKTSK